MIKEKSLLLSIAIQQLREYSDNDLVIGESGQFSIDGLGLTSHCPKEYRALILEELSKIPHSVRHVPLKDYHHNWEDGIYYHDYTDTIESIRLDGFFSISPLVGHSSENFNYSISEENDIFFLDSVYKSILSYKDKIDLERKKDYEDFCDKLDITPYNTDGSELGSSLELFESYTIIKS